MLHMYARILYPQICIHNLHLRIISEIKHVIRTVPHLIPSVTDS